MDDLDQCNKMIGKDDNKLLMASRHSNTSRQSSTVQEGSKTKKYFPFKQNYPFVATLRVGSEGIQMTVDGKHITSFAVREVIFFFFSSPFLFSSLHTCPSCILDVDRCMFLLIYLLSWPVIFPDIGAMACK